jgi:hypothetical protein
MSAKIKWSPESLLHESESERLRKDCASLRNDLIPDPIEVMKEVERRGKKPAISSTTLSQLGMQGADLRPLGEEAGNSAKEEVLKIFEDEGVSVRKIAKRLNESLDAMHQEVKLNKAGKFVYSDELVLHKVRLDAVKLGAEIFEVTEGDKGGKQQVLIIDSFNSGGDGHGRVDPLKNANPGPKTVILHEDDYKAPDTYTGADLPMPTAAPTQNKGEGKGEGK